MKKRIIRLVNLTASSFKGIKNMEVFFGEITDIKGDNGRNKSTIQACVKYGLGGSESNIKPLDKMGKVIYGLNPTVELTFYKDGALKRFCRSNVENWVKKKGETKTVLTGYKTLHYIDGVGVSQGEYNKVLKEFLEVDSLKLLIDPSYFPSLDWKEQRKIALDIIGDVNDEMVIEKNEELIPLLDVLKETSINDHLKVTKSKISKVKEEINTIPYRIEECTNSMEEIKDIEGCRFRVRSIKSEILELNKRREEIFLKLKERNTLNERLFSLKEEKRRLEKEKLNGIEAPILEKKEKALRLKKKIDELENKLALSNRNILGLKEEIQIKKESCGVYAIRKESLRQDWKKEDERELVFTEEDGVCPLCLRPYEGEVLDKAKEKALRLHEEGKEKRLALISAEGRNVAKYLEKLSFEKEEREREIAKILGTVSRINEEKEVTIIDFRELKEEIAEFKLNEPFVEEEKVLDRDIEELALKIRSIVVPSEKEVDEKIASLLIEEKDVEKAILRWEQNEKLQRRIEELQNRRSELEERQASLERREYLCEKFVRTKVSLLEENINSKFSLVSFKLFKEQINGGLSETCECTLDGVPYSSLSTAAKINAGLDIINTLSNHYGLSGPVFIDNRESINSIIETEAQVINLKVSRDEELVVEMGREFGCEVVDRLRGYVDRESKDVEVVVEPMRKRREIDF